MLSLGAAVAAAAAILLTDRAPVHEPRGVVAPYGQRRPPQLRFQFGVDTRGQTINLGVLSALSGPQAEVGRAVTDGQEAYWRVRDRSGGVRGWRVHLLVRDTADDSRRSRAALQTLLAHIAAVQQSFGYPATRALLHAVATRKLLVGVAAAQESALFGQPNLMLTSAPYSVDIANALAQVAARTPGARTSLVYEDNAVGRDGLQGYAVAGVAYHLTDAGRIRVASQPRGVAQRLAASHADVVVVSSEPRIAAAVITAAVRIAYRPLWILQDTAWRPSVAGALTSGNSRIWLCSSTSSLEHDVAFTAGYGQAAVMAKVLRRAIALNDLTPRGILDAKLTLGRVAVPAMAAIRFAPGLGAPTRSTALLDVRGADRRDWRVISPLREGAAARRLRFAAAAVIRPTR